jgi:hypothetical protein
MKKELFFLSISFLFSIQISFAQNNFINQYTDTSGIIIQDNLQQLIPTHDGGSIGFAGCYSVDSTLNIFKFNSAGQNEWVSKFNVHGYWMFPGEIIELQNHDFVSSGVFYKTNSFLHTTDFLLRIDSMGSLKKFLVNGDSLVVYAGWGITSIAGSSANGEVIYAGPIDIIDSLSWTGTNLFLTKVDSSGNVLWNTYFQPDTGINNSNCVRAKETSDGNFIVTGTYAYMNSGNYFFISKIDSSGILKWSRHRYSPSHLGRIGIPIELDGYYYILHVDDNTGVPQIFKFDTSGQLIWHKRYENIYSIGTDANMINKTSDGKIIFLGREKLTLSPLVIEIDSSGTMINSIQYDYQPLQLTNFIESSLGKYVLYGGGLAYYYLLSLDSIFQPNCITTNFNPAPPIDISDTFVLSGSSYITTKTFQDLSSYINTKSGYYTGTDICAFMGDANTNADLKRINIFPNPANNHFIISCNLFTNGSLEIFNLFGEKIYTAAFHEPTTVNCEYFPRGIYFVRLSNSENQFIKKLVIN